MSDNLLRLVKPAEVAVQEMSDENMIYAIYSKILSQAGSSSAKPAVNAAAPANSAPARISAISSRR